MYNQSIVIFLESKVPCFCLQKRHVDRLRKEQPQAEIVWCRDIDSFLDALPRADIVFSWRFKQDWFERAPRLRRIGTPAAGRDFFEVTSVPDHVEIRNGTFHGPIMAETAVGMMLGVNRGILTAYKHQINGELWPNQALFGSRLLHDTHAVIIGFGRIGQHIARLLKPFGVRITGIRQHAVSDVPEWFTENDSVKITDELHGVLAEADHVIMLLPSDTGTDDFMSESEFKVMPEHAVVYNLGRGNSINETDLANALRNGEIAGACLDVFAQEPLSETSPLSDENLPGLIRMPHASAFCDQYIDRFLDEFSDWLQ